MIRDDMVVDLPLTDEDLKTIWDHLRKERYDNNNTWPHKEVPADVSHGIAWQVRLARFYDVDPFKENTVGYDFIVDGKKVDAKAEPYFRPDLDHYAMIPKDDMDKAGCDEFVFGIVDIERRQTWGIGKCTRAAFLQEPTIFKKAGESFGPGDRWTVKVDCWLRQYRYLDKPLVVPITKFWS